MFNRVPACGPPADIPCRYQLYILYREAGRLDEAEAAVRALRVLAPDWNVEFSQAKTLLFKGEPQAALDLIAEQEGNPRVLAIRAMALHDLSRQAEFDAVFAELREQGAKDHPDEIARVHAWTGEADAAFEWLEKSTPPNKTRRHALSARTEFRQTAHRSALARLLERLGLAPEQLAAIKFKITLPSDGRDGGVPYSNIPFGVSPLRKGSMKAYSRSGWVITAVCEVAGSTARREAGNGLPISPMTPPPSSRKSADRMLQRRHVGIAGDDEHRRLQRLDVRLPRHRLLLELRSASSPAPESRRDWPRACDNRLQMAFPTNISTVICGMNALNSGCQPSAS